MHQLFWILWLHLWSTLGRRGYDIYRWTRPNRPPRIFPESLLHRNTESLSHDCDCGSVNLDVMPENERYLFNNMVSTTMIRQNKCNDILGLTIKSNQNRVNKVRNKFLQELMKRCSDGKIHWSAERWASLERGALILL